MQTKSENTYHGQGVRVLLIVIQFIFLSFDEWLTVQLHSCTLHAALYKHVVKFVSSKVFETFLNNVDQS